MHICVSSRPRSVTGRRHGECTKETVNDWTTETGASTRRPNMDIRPKISARSRFPSAIRTTSALLRKGVKSRFTAQPLPLIWQFHHPQGLLHSFPAKRFMLFLSYHGWCDGSVNLSLALSHTLFHSWYHSVVFYEYFAWCDIFNHSIF